LSNDDCNYDSCSGDTCKLSGAACATDEDCNAHAECLQNYEWNIDIDDDNNADTTVNVDMCLKWPTAESKDCLTDSDCPDDEHCQFRVKGTGVGTERTWAVEYKCRKNYEEQVEMCSEVNDVGVCKASACGGSTGKTCKTDLCLVPGGSSDSTAMCVDYCESYTDCPDYVKFDGKTSRSMCLSFTINKSDSPEKIDDFYASHCWRVTSNSSLKPCEETKTCSDPNEYCRALTIAGAPDEAVKIEYLCVYIGDNGSGGSLSTLPTKQVGEECASNSECLTRSCLAKGDSKYCSTLCNTDEDCTNDFDLSLSCTEVEVVPRPDKINAGIVNRCIVKETCATCSSDDQCGGDYVCTNFGGLGFLVDYRCGPPCATDDDCLDAGAICKADFDETGEPTGQKACVPTGGCGPKKDG
jgi:hypothetical protein